MYWALPCITGLKQRYLIYIRTLIQLCRSLQVCLSQTSDGLIVCAGAPTLNGNCLLECWILNVVRAEQEIFPPSCWTYKTFMIHGRYSRGNHLTLTPRSGWEGLDDVLLLFFYISSPYKHAESDKMLSFHRFPIDQRLIRWCIVLIWRDIRPHFEVKQLIW